MQAMHVPLRHEILEELGEVIDANAFVNGPQVARFEASFAAWCGTSECVGVSSGLDALRLGLLALDLAVGDEVIVPANTFVATVEAVTQARLKPVLVDATAGDYGLDPGLVEAAIGPRTRAILPVHLYGQLADMRALQEIAARHDLVIIEDAAQAHGAERDGIRAGTGGLMAGFSFYPGKNLGAMGDAGALVTNDAEVAARVRSLREHGQQRKYVHEWEGYTARLDTMQAVVLEHKLPHLEAWNAQRAAAARAYTQGLAGIGDLTLPTTATGSSPVWHLYVVRTSEPERLGAFLRDRTIATGRHYPIPVHLAPAYAYLGLTAGTFPVSEALAQECLSLPLFPGITGSQVATVVDAVIAYFNDEL
jgi:dTDP-4-amino-4,6-dideoxygalactose transaminase